MTPWNWHAWLTYRVPLTFQSGLLSEPQATRRHPGGSADFLPPFFHFNSLGETCCSPSASILVKGLGTGNSEEHKVGGRGQESQ